MQDHEALDRILQAISQTQPPSGMDHRLLRALNASRAVPRRPLWFQPKIAWSLTATLLLIAGLIPVFRHPVPPSRTPQLISAPNLPAVETLAVVTHPPVRRHRQNSQPLPATVAFTSLESFPAPPMPLTDQEKLLLRLVRRADPQQLAMLDPNLRLERESADVADFNAFFQPPTAAAEEPIPLLPLGDTE